MNTDNPILQQVILRLEERNNNVQQFQDRYAEKLVIELKRGDLWKK